MPPRRDHQAGEASSSAQLQERDLEFWKGD